VFLFKGSVNRYVSFHIVNEQSCRRQNLRRMNSRIEIAERAAREAGALLRSLLGTNINVRAKDVRTNLVTEADTRSETLIRHIIAEHFPQDAVLGEESGATGDASLGRWHVDPLDGTTNYAHGYRCFCVSIAYEREGKIELGCVYDPMADEFFRATRGGGAQCNGVSIHVSDCDDLRAAMLVTGFPAHRVLHPNANLDAFADFLNITRAIRRDGAAALDLCYVACGRFDGFWEPALHSWDIAAGTLIVEEAGGRTSDYAGGPMQLDGAQLLATNGRIHEAMIEVVGKYAPDW
jgi:myo-inositol-1(or 4)-monophosphatase